MKNKYLKNTMILLLFPFTSIVSIIEVKYIQLIVFFLFGIMFVIISWKRYKNTGKLYKSKASTIDDYIGLLMLALSFIIGHLMSDFFHIENIKISF